MKRESKSSTLTEEDGKRYTGVLWQVLLGLVAFACLFLLSVRIGIFGQLPTSKDLENPKSNLASEILTDDNRVLGTYFVHNRSNVKYTELAPSLVHALISTEDKRCYEHY